MKLASVDIGTNTAQMLVVESRTQGCFEVLADIHAIVRLGEGVDATHAISEAAFERLRQVVMMHQNRLETLGINHAAFVATSAMRDASNRDSIIARIEQEFGVRIELLSSQDESRFSYRGAASGLQNLAQGEALATLDIGGGSTELSFGNGSHFLRGTSMDIGALRLTERFLTAKPYNREQIVKAREYIRSVLKQSPSGTPKLSRIVAVSGTPTSLAAMALKLATFDQAAVHGYILSRPIIRSLIEIITTSTADELIATYPAIHPGRADICLAGSLILDETLDMLGLDTVTVSTYGLHYGIAIRELERAYNLGEQVWVVKQSGLVLAQQ
jgi:exopolyphosphatase/guanosine-5'-triphosphate,3'-diphosphate pyrophosphatase